MTHITRSDYLDTSRPNTLRAFFAYCDAANIAYHGFPKIVTEMKPLDPKMTQCIVALLEGQRQRASQAALDILVTGIS